VTLNPVLKKGGKSSQVEDAKKSGEGMEKLTENLATVQLLVLFKANEGRRTQAERRPLEDHLRHCWGWGGGVGFVLVWGVGGLFGVFCLLLGVFLVFGAKGRGEDPAKRARNSYLTRKIERRSARGLQGEEKAGP